MEKQYVKRGLKRAKADIDCGKGQHDEHNDIDVSQNWWLIHGYVRWFLAGVVVFRPRGTFHGKCMTR